jgi:tRNA(Ile)-lysidine synthase
MELLFNAIKSFYLKHGVDRTYWLALSGGLDSSVLLHLLVNLRSLYPIKLHAVHVHHGLSSNADSWGEHCEKVCRQFSVEFTQYNVNAVAASGDSPEEVARQRRYDVFKQCIQANDIILTAHHQDDQAETLLLQLFRGAGPKGLAAMSAFNKFKQGYLARPLLNFSRQSLHEYALHHQLAWIDDESNANTNFTRNFVRHEVISLLKSRWPNVTATLSRVAEHCAQTQELLENFSERDLEGCYGSKPDTLSVKQLLQLTLERQRQVIRLWLSRANRPIPSTIKMHHIVHDVLHARADKLPLVMWGEVELRRYQDDIYILPKLQSHDEMKSFAWNLNQSLELSANGMLVVVPTLGEGLRADVQSVSVRYRRGGENFQLPGRSHHHSLKKLFQAWGIPPWQRDRVPLIFVGNELAVVVGYGIADKFVVAGDQAGLVVTHIRRTALYARYPEIFLKL